MTTEMHYDNLTDLDGNDLFVVFDRGGDGFWYVAAEFSSEELAVKYIEEWKCQKY